MGEIVNLRRVMKARERQRAATLAAENRALHGRTIAQERVERQTKERKKSALDGARIDAPQADPKS